MKYPLLSLVLLLACVGCKPSASPPPVSDEALRALLGASSIRGSFEIPKGDELFLVAALTFEDGKLTGHSLMRNGGTKHLSSRTINVEFAWMRSGETAALALICGGAYGSSGDTSDFWRRLKDEPKGTSTASGIESVNQLKIGEVVVLGYIHSLEAEKSNEASDVMEGALKSVVESSKYVGALVAKTFKTQDEMEAFRNQLLNLKK